MCPFSKRKIWGLKRSNNLHVVKKLVSEKLGSKSKQSNPSSVLVITTLFSFRKSSSSNEWACWSVCWVTWACWNHRQSILNQTLGMDEISTGGIKAEDDEWQRKIYDLLHESICTRNLILFAACLPFCPICRSFDSCFEEPQLSDT